jgi:alpha-N-arabinofuranosidase
MKTAKMTADKDFRIGKVEDRLIGSFVEHMGSCVYNGIFEPGHPQADENGFRRDVLELVKALKLAVIRYPGGNFASGYDWEDTVGPDRPVTMDLAWQALNPNTFGLDEFIKWAGQVGAEPIMTFNLGTGSPKDACRLLEYANFPGGTRLSNRRIAHGRKDPYNIRTWCLGNELDGEWQICHKTAAEYGRIAAETARMLRAMDPSLELIVVGSSFNKMPTFPEWDREVMMQTYNDVDFLSLHKYILREGRPLNEYLAMPLEMESQIREIITTCDYVKSCLRSKKTMMLSFDEFMPANPDQVVLPEPWQIGAERDMANYSLEDALVFGMLLLSLLRHCDRVKIACQAILINVVPLILAKKNGPAWANTTYYPMLHLSRYGRGEVLDTILEGPRYAAGEYGDVDGLDHVAVYHAESGEVDVFCVNRTAEPIAFSFEARGFDSGFRLAEHIALDGDSKARNTMDQPLACVPRNVLDSMESDGSSVRLSAYSWNVLRYVKEA